MFRFKTHQLNLAALKWRAPQRTLLQPEKLESRDLPGGCVYAAPLVGTLDSSVSEPPSVVASDSSSGPQQRSGSAGLVSLAPALTNNDSLCLLNQPQAEKTQITSNSSSPIEKAGVAARTSAGSVSTSIRSMLATSAMTSVVAQPSNIAQSSVNAYAAPLAPYQSMKAGGGGAGGGGSQGGSGGGGGSTGEAGKTVAPSAKTVSAALGAKAIQGSLAAPQMSAIMAGPVPLPFTASGPLIASGEVKTLLDRASAATNRNDAIIAVVDREGRILGVRVEAGLSFATTEAMVFAIDGAVAKARTAAFFSNDQAPLTSRTVRFISQSTITQREVESDPNSAVSTINGPGFVAPIGLGGHFPPDVKFTPQVDLFAIEHTNRDSLLHNGKDTVRGTVDDQNLATRFHAQFQVGGDIPAPESYGRVSGDLPLAQSRGIATLPGGVPLFKIDPADHNLPKLVGGVGVFFPGPNGYATFEQNFQPSAALGKKAQTTGDRTNAPLVLQAEYMAVAAAGGVGTIAGIPLPAGYTLPQGRIDLAGITLEIYGPHPKDLSGLLAFGKKIGTAAPSGMDVKVEPGGMKYLNGQGVPEGWLVAPQASGNLTAMDVQTIIENGIAEANRVRAAIRLPISQPTKMMLSVTDTNGKILGLYRMHDATFFSIDVAVAKARNVAYYDDPTALQQPDKVDDNNNGVPDVAPGVAFTNRTFRYLATPFFPEGIDGTRPPDFSILNDPGINPKNAENLGAPTPANQFTSVLGYDSFHPDTNFRELSDPAAVTGNQNGVVFFPGSTPLYKNGVLVGGLGVSGDGVDQDDIVTFSGGGSFIPQPGGPIVRVDQVAVRGIGLPFMKFPRNPHGGIKS